MLVMFCQLVMGVVICYLLIGPFLKRIGQTFRPKNRLLVRTCFAFIFFLVTLATIILIPAVLFR